MLTARWLAAEKLEEMQRKLPAVSSFAGLPAFGNDADSSDDSDSGEGAPSTASSLMAAEARDRDPLNLPKGRAQVTTQHPKPKP